MAEVVLLVAVGCGRMTGILDIAAMHPFVVFGTMDGEVLANLNPPVLNSPPSTLPVYFYETG